MRAATASFLTLLTLLPAAAQTPPTATEAFNLRIRCKEMAAAKLESLLPLHPLSAEEGASYGWANVQSANSAIPEVVHAMPYIRDKWVTTP
jgi:hypothetical protein